MELEETALGIYDYLLGRLALEYYSENSEEKLVKMLKSYEEKVKENNGFEWPPKDTEFVDFEELLKPVRLDVSHYFK